MLIGLVATVIVKSIFRQKIVVAVMAGLLAFAVHRRFDAPVARKLSELLPQLKPGWDARGNTDSYKVSLNGTLRMVVKHP